MREKEIEKIKEYKYGFSTNIENVRAPKGLDKKVIKFISKIKKKDIVKSIRGKNGGYILTKEPARIKLSNIFSAVDEKVKTLLCKRESKKGCNSKSTKCITHYLWDDLEMHINDFFDKKNLGDLLKNNLETRI